MPDALIRVRVQPGARRNEVVRNPDGRLLVRVKTPPTEGRANKAACKLLAEAAGIPPSRVEVVRGVSSRDKTIRLEGLTPAEAADRFGYYP